MRFLGFGPFLHRLVRQTSESACIRLLECLVFRGFMTFRVLLLRDGIILLGDEIQSFFWSFGQSFTYFGKSRMTRKNLRIYSFFLMDFCLKNDLFYLNNQLVVSNFYEINVWFFIPADLKPQKMYFLRFFFIK